MGRPYQILMPLLSLFFVRVDLTDLWTVKLPVTLVKVQDGDTLVVENNKTIYRVRLSKIDAPEKGQPFWDGRGDAGLEAKKCLENLLSKKPHTLHIFKRDIYGRVLGEIDDLSLRLIQEGCVSLYPHAEFSSKQERAMYLREMRIAKSKKKGLWKRGGFRQPKLWRKSSKRT